MAVRAAEISPAAIERATEDGVPVLPVEELVQGADFLSLHCDLNPSSRHLVSAALLAKARPSAVVINTARGGLVDQEALVRALQAGEIAGAALDVFELEPLPQQSPLRVMQNVLLSPHASNASPICWRRVHEVTIRNTLKAIGLTEVDEVFKTLRPHRG